MVRLVTQVSYLTGKWDVRVQVFKSPLYGMPIFDAVRACQIIGPWYRSTEARCYEISILR